MKSQDALQYQKTYIYSSYLRLSKAIKKTPVEHRSLNVKKPLQYQAMKFLKT